MAFGGRGNIRGFRPTYVSAKTESTSPAAKALSLSQLFEAERTKVLYLFMHPFIEYSPVSAQLLNAVRDNWAFLYAQRLALAQKSQLHVCFCLVTKFMDATIRHFRFMLGGLREVEEECRSLKIPFHVLLGEAKSSLIEFVEEHQLGTVVTDFSPLHVPMSWVENVKSSLPDEVDLIRVDAHNVVPAWVTSNGMEPAAFKIRAKLEPKLDEFLTQFPPAIKHPFNIGPFPKDVEWEKLEAALEVDRSIDSVEWAKPGTRSGLKTLENFIEKHLSIYGEKRNEPNVCCQSNLSPWFHFELHSSLAKNLFCSDAFFAFDMSVGVSPFHLGQIAPQRAILQVKKYENIYPKSYASFINEALVWRELAENFCFYNKNYDNFSGAPGWAQESLLKHSVDKRQYLYTLEEFEAAKTHDDLWNAAQIQMVVEGKMHGFLRMYWAKKIQEWTPSPEDAVRIALYLNDRYNLDGRDPNGFGGEHFSAISILELLSRTFRLLFAGVMWAICGVHDRPFGERPVTGSVRCMTYFASQRKFDVDAFVKRYGAKVYNKLGNH
ncbi:unnamed protein product [Notodromas monacha]|uniref:Deoxyribodipyrimidine photo-lyase n=1 Tax=Notodromas monacha TaxID=399045 RepID=A0A7R9GA31_9CRUS|nr:unnamed protein product [Notodromas monacha]CAG0913579.1 unnamed protein product [Notodromas monacha]